MQWGNYFSLLFKERGSALFITKISRATDGGKTFYELMIKSTKVHFGTKLQVIQEQRFLEVNVFDIKITVLHQNSSFSITGSKFISQNSIVYWYLKPSKVMSFSEKQRVFIKRRPKTKDRKRRRRRIQP